MLLETICPASQQSRLSWISFQAAVSQFYQHLYRKNSRISTPWLNSSLYRRRSGRYEIPLPPFTFTFEYALNDPRKAVNADEYVWYIEMKGRCLYTNVYVARCYIQWINSLFIHCDLPMDLSLYSFNHW